MHRKLQRSVTEILRSVICLPNLSCSVIFRCRAKKWPDSKLESGARRKQERLGVALLSNQVILTGDWREFQHRCWFAFGRLRRFRLNPHPKNSGIARVAMG